MAVEDIVAEDQCHRIAGYEVLADQKRLGKAARIRLNGVAEFRGPTGCRRQAGAEKAS